MNNYNEMIGETVYMDEGEYTIVAHVYDDGCADNSINLYVGKAIDGHHDLIASDSASMWVVGSEDDAKLNRDQWDTISDRCDVAPVFDEVRKIDADLANWLADRYEDAKTTLAIVRRNDYISGDLCFGVAYNCHAKDNYDAITALWDHIGVGDIIIRGLGDYRRIYRLVDVEAERLTTVEGYCDLSAPFCVAMIGDEAGEVETDMLGECDCWEFYSADGRRLTTEEAFDER